MKLRILFVLAIALLLSACTGSPRSAAPAPAGGNPGSQAPQANDPFRPMSAGMVGTTGKPQLVEFFAFW